MGQIACHGYVMLLLNRRQRRGYLLQHTGVSQHVARLPNPIWWQLQTRQGVGHYVVTGPGCSGIGLMCFDAVCAGLCAVLCCAGGCAGCRRHVYSGWLGKPTASFDLWIIIQRVHLCAVAYAMLCRGLRWLPQASLIKHAFEALCINEFKGLTFELDDKGGGMKTGGLRAASVAGWDSWMGIGMVGCRWKGHDGRCRF